MRGAQYSVLFHEFGGTAHGQNQRVFQKRGAKAHMASTWTFWIAKTEEERRLNRVTRRREVYILLRPCPSNIFFECRAFVQVLNPISLGTLRVVI